MLQAFHYHRQVYFLLLELNLILHFRLRSLIFHRDPDLLRTSQCVYIN